MKRDDPYIKRKFEATMVGPVSRGWYMTPISEDDGSITWWSVRVDGNGPVATLWFSYQEDAPRKIPTSLSLYSNGALCGTAKPIAKALAHA